MISRVRKVFARKLSKNSFSCLSLPRSPHRRLRLSANPRNPKRLRRLDIAKQHDNTKRAVVDALPLVLPSWSLPFYFGMHMDEKKDEKKKTKK